MKTRMLITGATSGLGSYLAHYFAAQGFELFLHGRDPEKMSALATSLDGVEAHYFEADLTSASAIQHMFSKIEQKTDSLNILVNNAFGKLEDPLVDADPTAIYDFFQTCLAGTAEVIRNSVPLLKKCQPSHVINIAADWGFPMHNIMTGPSLYIAAKYGIHGLGAALQTELAPFGIRTTNVCPGVIAAGESFQPNSVVNHNDVGSIHPDEIARTIAFVFSQRSAHVRSIVLSPTDPNYNGL